LTDDVGPILKEHTVFFIRAKDAFNTLREVRWGYWWRVWVW